MILEIEATGICNAQCPFCSRFTFDRDNLEIYKGNPAQISKKIKLRGIPTTLIINKDGLEIARAIGEIDFEEKEFINWIDKLI